MSENQAKSKMRFERIPFEPYIKSTYLTEAVEHFRKRIGYYPKRVLANQIYRAKENRKYCGEHEIRLSDPRLERPCAIAKVDKKQEYKAQMRLGDTDGIEVERSFSLSKRCYGMGCIVTKLKKHRLH